MWARADGGQEVVARVDVIVESRARHLTDALHELGSDKSESIASYFVLVRTGDEWDIKDRVSAAYHEQSTGARSERSVKPRDVRGGLVSVIERSAHAG
ncbi:MAG: hypothetical protein ACLP8S_15680, partial [Solirubrobacteraceae bacterium]